MDPFEERLRRKAELQQERLHLVQNELALASTFLDVAKTTRQPETRERNIKNARTACEAVCDILAGKFDCTPKQRAAIEDTLAKLIARLKEETAAISPNAPPKSSAHPSLFRIISHPKKVRSWPGSAF